MVRGNDAQFANDTVLVSVPKKRALRMPSISHDFYAHISIIKYCTAHEHVEHVCTDIFATNAAVSIVWLKPLKLAHSRWNPSRSDDAIGLSTQPIRFWRFRCGACCRCRGV